MTAVTYRETLAGFVDFGADDWNEGWIGGREVSSGCAIHLDVRIDDIDRFVEDRAPTATPPDGCAATGSAGASRSSGAGSTPCARSTGRATVTWTTGCTCATRPAGR